jgi:hypothetical protein
MRHFIQDVTSHSWVRAVAGGGLGIALAELRQLRGKEPNHPLANEERRAA